MLGRFRAVIPAVCVLLLLRVAGPVFGHGVKAEYRVLPNRQIQIEAWYDVTADPAANAKVTVLERDNKLAEGHSDQKGVFVFSYQQAVDLRVIIDAGGGHRANLHIPAAELVERDKPRDGAGGESLAGTPLADRSTRVSYKDVVLGVALVLAAAAFWLSWRNARKISEMRNRLH